MTDMNYTKI